MTAPTNRWEGGGGLAQTATVSVPDAEVGVVLFATSAVSNTGITVPGDANAGWTQLYFVQEGSLRFFVHWKLADGADDYTTSWTGNAYNYHVVTEYSPYTEIEEAGAAMGTIASGVTMPMSPVTPVSNAGVVVALAAMRRQNEWGLADASNDVAAITIDSSYVKDYARSLNGNVLDPPICGAHLDYAAIAAYSAAWNTTDAGGIAAYYSVALPGSAPPITGVWNKSNVIANLDAVGVTGLPDEATTVTATAPNGSIIADAVVVASGTHTTRWFLKGVTVTGNIEITLDGTTWQVCPPLSTIEFTEVLSDQVLANPTIGIRLQNSGDVVIVGNAELHLNMSSATVAGSTPVQTLDAPATVYSQAGTEQSGVWTPDAAKESVPDNSRNYPMNEGSGDTFGETVTGQDATIQNPNSPGGGWT